MQRPLITLSTDFGTADAYVGAMKGVILAINPDADLVDLSHELSAHDVLAGALFLAGAIPFFPPGAIHVVVVDPGVGTERRLLYAELGPHRLLLPDNGLLTLLAERQPPRRLIQLTNAAYWRERVAPTFHGRDILAPVAAHLSRGVEPSELGPAADGWMRLPIPVAHSEGATVRGEVIHIDRFGNLITNIDAADVGRLKNPSLRIGARDVPLIRTYGERTAGETVALISSAGFVEVAVVQGRACDVLGIGRGTSIVVVDGPQGVGVRNEQFPRPGDWPRVKP